MILISLINVWTEKKWGAGLKEIEQTPFPLLIPGGFSGLGVPTSLVWDRLSHGGNRETENTWFQEWVYLSLSGRTEESEEVPGTHRNTLKGRRVHCPVDLVSNGLVVVVEVFQAHTWAAIPSRCLVQSQCQGPDSIISQGCLLEATCLLRVSF